MNIYWLIVMYNIFVICKGDWYDLSYYVFDREGREIINNIFINKISLYCFKCY